MAWSQARSLLSPFCPGLSYDSDRSAVVERAIDGDTIELTGGERVRYIGMDTLESGEPSFTEATQRNAALVAGLQERQLW